MVVDCGASDHLTDNDYITRPWGTKREGLHKREELKTIVTAGNGRQSQQHQTPFLILGYLIEPTGKRVPVHVAAMLAPGLLGDASLSPSSQQCNQGL